MSRGLRLGNGALNLMAPCCTKMERRQSLRLRRCFVLGEQEVKLPLCQPI